MLGIIQKLGYNKTRIEDERVSGSYETATSIAESYGYGFRGFVNIKHDSLAILLDRKSGYDRKEYMNIIQRLKKNGYGFVQITIPYEHIPEIDVVLGKEYESGSTAVMERPGSALRKPVAIAGYEDGISLLGIFLDTSPEHVGEIQDIAYALGMEPLTKVTDAIGDFLATLDLSNL